MSITNESELIGMQKASEAVAYALKEMRNFAKAGISTKELDDFGGKILEEMGAKSAPYLTYGFPGYTCISVNNEFCHGIPSEKTILKEGDLINIDVSAELNGFWSDNGGSFVIGEDINQHQKLIDASKEIQIGILKEGDLINIDVSAELNGFWSDNGGSFVIGEDINQHQKLIDASKEI